MHNFNNMCLDLNHVKKIIIKRLGPGYPISGNTHRIDFPLKDQLFCILEQLNMEYPEYYNHRNFLSYLRENPHFEKTLNKNISSIRFYDDLVMLLNLVLFASNPH